MAAPIHFAGRLLETKRHVCAFFDTHEDEYRLTFPFVKEGIERGERAFQIVDPAERAAYLGRLDAHGIPVRACEQSGQLEVRTWDQAYLRDGHFDQNRMLALLEDTLKEGRARGYPLTRLVAHMEWALADRPGSTTSSRTRRG